VAKRAGPNGPARQSVLKGTGWIEDFNPLTCSGPSRPVQSVNLTGQSTGQPILARLKKIKNKKN